MRTLYFLALLCCIGCKDRGPPLEDVPPDLALPVAPPTRRPPPFENLGDRPLRAKIQFTALHDLNGKNALREITIRGMLNGAGELKFNPNILEIDDDGNIVGTTCVGFFPIAIRIAATDTPDPAGNDRRVYDLVPIKSEFDWKLSIILSPNEAGPHDLLIREGDRTLGIYKLVDPGRREHAYLSTHLAKATAGEREAIAELRKEIGYSFRFRQEVKDDITFLYIPDAGDVCRLDAALKKLPNLLHLSFHGGRLGPEGLKCLGNIPQLKTLEFTDMEIDDGGLSCLKDAPQLERISLDGSRGITDAGLSHFRGLKDLKSLDLRNEKYDAMERKPPRITDIGLGHLAGLTELEYLNVTGQDITDVGMKQLEGLKKLSVIHVTGGKFSPLQKRPMK